MQAILGTFRRGGPAASDSPVAWEIRGGTGAFLRVAEAAGSPGEGRKKNGEPKLAVFVAAAWRDQKFAVTVRKILRPSASYTTG